MLCPGAPFKYALNRPVLVEIARRLGRADSFSSSHWNPILSDKRGGAQAVLRGAARF